MKTIYRCDTCQFDVVNQLRKPNCKTNQLRYPCTFRYSCMAYKKKYDCHAEYEKEITVNTFQINNLVENND